MILALGSQRARSTEEGSELQSHWLSQGFFFFFQMTSCCTLVKRQEEGVPGISHPFSASILKLCLSSYPLCFLFFSLLSLQNVHYWEHSARFLWLWSLPLIRREELPRPHQSLGDWPFFLFWIMWYCRVQSIFSVFPSWSACWFYNHQYWNHPLHINTESEMTEPFQMVLESDLIPRQNSFQIFFYYF